MEDPTCLYYNNTNKTGKFPGQNRKRKKTGLHPMQNITGQSGMVGPGHDGKSILPGHGKYGVWEPIKKFTHTIKINYCQ